MISKYIKELIPGNSRIIIPDFGAFMIQDTPTGKVISFNDFLKFNDSVLLNKIITSEKVDATKGKEAIKAYVTEIETAFKAGESFAVEGVGYLSKDGQNNINFVQDESAKAKGKTKATAKSKAEPKAEVKAEDAKPASAPAAEPKAAAPEVKPQPAAAPKPQAAAPQPTATPKTTYINNSYTNNKMEIKTKNNKSVTTVLIIVAALVIVGVLVWMAIDFNWFGPFKKAKEAPAAPVEVIDTTPVVDTVAVDTVAVVEEPEPVIVSEPTIDPSSKRCHIIAGSFQIESNALRYQEDMRSRGYDAQIVTRNTGYYYVSIKQFDTRSEAVAEWRNMVYENPNLWILIK